MKSGDVLDWPPIRSARACPSRICQDQAIFTYSLPTVCRWGSSEPGQDQAILTYSLPTVWSWGSFPTSQDQAILTYSLLAAYP